MGRPKGSKNGTSKVATSKQEAPKASKPASKRNHAKTGQSVHRSVERVHRPRKTEDRATDKPVSSNQEPSAPRQPRTRKLAQEAPEIESAWSIWDTFMLLGAGVILLVVISVIIARFA